MADYGQDSFSFPDPNKADMPYFTDEGIPLEGYPNVEIPQATLVTTPGNFQGTLPTIPSSLYNDYQIDTRYETITGGILQPVAGPPGTPPELLFVHSQYSTKVVKWTTERQGSPPELPSSDTLNPNDAPLYLTVQPAAPVPGPDGFCVYRVSGMYVYGITTTLDNTAVLKSGRLPKTVVGDDQTAPTIENVVSFDVDSTDFKTYFLS